MTQSPEQGAEAPYRSQSVAICHDLSRSATICRDLPAVT